MKLNAFVVLTLSVFVTACTSLQTSLNSEPVPSGRMFISNENSGQESAQLNIIRDRSLAGSLCYYAIVIDDKLVSRIGPSEKATFNLSAGERKIQITRDKQGEGLCSDGDDETTRQITLKPNEKRFYRLSLNMAGSPNLKVLEVQDSD